MSETTQAIAASTAPGEHGFVRAIGLFDGTMIVVGSMIGSGIFIVASDISQQTGSAGGLLLTWVLTGLLTIPRRFLTVSWRHCFLTPAANTFICARLIRRFGDSFTAGHFSW